MLQKIICVIRGHKSLKQDTQYTRHYVEIPAGRGAFCRDPIRYLSSGRLFKCSRCGQLQLVTGVLSWELMELIQVTLEDLPDSVFNFPYDYEFIQIFSREKMCG